MNARAPASGLDPDILRSLKRDVTRMAVAVGIVFAMLVAWNTALGVALGFTEREAGAIGFWGFFGFGLLMGLLALPLVWRMLKARREALDGAGQPPQAAEPR